MNATRNASTTNTTIAPVIHFSMRFNNFITHTLLLSFSRSSLGLFLLLVWCTRGTCTVFFLIQESKLFHHRKLIKCRPLLFYFSIHDSPHRNSGLFHFLPSGR